MAELSTTAAAYEGLAAAEGDWSALEEAAHAGDVEIAGRPRWSRTARASPSSFIASHTTDGGKVPSLAPLWASCSRRRSSAVLWWARPVVALFPT